MKITVKELLKKLQEIDKESNRQAHGEPEIFVSLDFKDPELDSRYFFGEVVGIEDNLRPGCRCVDGLNITIEIEEIK